MGRFAGRFKPSVFLALVYLSASVLSCAHETERIDAFTLKPPAAVAQTSDETGPMAGDRDVTLNLNGLILHFRIPMGMLGVGVMPHPRRFARYCGFSGCNGAAPGEGSGSSQPSIEEGNQRA